MKILRAVFILKNSEKTEKTQDELFSGLDEKAHRGVGDRLGDP